MSQQQYVTDFFASTATYWQSVYADDTLVSTIYQDRHSTALGWVQDLDLRPNARILEVGCGAGLLKPQFGPPRNAVCCVGAATNR